MNPMSKRTKKRSKSKALTSSVSGRQNHAIPKNLIPTLEQNKQQSNYYSVSNLAVRKLRYVSSKDLYAKEKQREQKRPLMLDTEMGNGCVAMMTAIVSLAGLALWIICIII